MNCGLGLRQALLLLLLAGSASAGADAGPAPVKERSMESAKRRGPSARPVEHEGVRYEQLRRARDQGFAQAGGVIAATEIASGRQLWVVQLYQTTFDPAEERDVQEVYVAELRMDEKSGLLRAQDERRRVWWLRPQDGQLLEAPVGASHGGTPPQPR